MTFVCCHILSSGLNCLFPPTVLWFFSYLSKGHRSEPWQREAAGMSRQEPCLSPSCRGQNDHEGVLWVSQHVCKVTVNTPFFVQQKHACLRNTVNRAGTRPWGDRRALGPAHSVRVSSPRRNIQPEGKVTPSWRQHECDCLQLFRRLTKAPTPKIHCGTNQPCKQAQPDLLLTFSFDLLPINIIAAPVKLGQTHNYSTVWRRL